MECKICSADEETANQVWYAYANRLRMRDALHSAQTMIDENLTYDQVASHIRSHHYIQPSPPGKGLNRSLALQEALTSFPRYWFYMLLAIYRAQALSEQQLYKMFYLDHAKDSVALHEQMQSDLQRLSSRSFLYRLWPDSLAHTLNFEDPGPYYFLNRQSIPLVERLEGMEPGSMTFGAYVTSSQQVQEFYLERDARFMGAIVAMRDSLYLKEFSFEGKATTVHLGIEHWYAPVQIHCELSEGDVFAPSALLGFRFESRDGSMSHMLPAWFEYDRGTDEPGDVADEVLRYARYYESPAYRERFPLLAAHSCPGPLIVVCDDAYRREEVRAALGQRLGGQRLPVFLVERASLISDPYAEGIMLTPGDDSARFSLLQSVWDACEPLRVAHAIPGTGSLTDGAKTAAPKQVAETVNVEGWGS